MLPALIALFIYNLASANSQNRIEQDALSQRIASVEHVLYGSITGIEDEVNGYQQFTFKISEDIKGDRARCDRPPPRSFCRESFTVILRTKGASCDSLLPLRENGEYLFLLARQGTFVTTDGIFDCDNLSLVERAVERSLAEIKKEIEPGRVFDYKPEP